jgi:SAM-dependent methyltransferase
MRLETINCIFCNHDNGRIVIEENGYIGKKCAQCGLIYISPRPPIQEIADIYGHDLSHSSAASHISGHFIKRLFARYTLARIIKFIKSGILLEIGSGGGRFLYEARKKSFTVYGIELNPALAEFINTTLQIPCSSAPLESSSFAGSHYDIIYHCDVISHLHDPITSFSTMNRLLRDKGWLVFETGNFGDVEPAHYRHISRFQYPDHLFFFTENNLETLLHETGFAIVKIYRYSLIPQIILTKKFHQLVHKMRPGNPAVQARTCHGAEQAVTRKSSMTFSPSGLCRLFKKAYSYAFNIFFNYGNDYLSFFSRYYLGRLAPKQGRPQTVIIIARKI